MSRQVEQLARQRNAERDAQIAKTHPAKTHPAKTVDQNRPAASPGLRSQTGWAIVSIGLRIAESENR
jgi:hypothetical protein